MGFFLYYAILFILPRLLIEWGSFFQFGGTKFLLDEMIRLSSMAFSFIIINSTLFAIPLFLVVLATQAAMSGKINFAPGAMKFKGSKINPLAGLKRMFSKGVLFIKTRVYLQCLFAIPLETDHFSFQRT